MKSDRRHIKHNTVWVLVPLIIFTFACNLPSFQRTASSTQIPNLSTLIGGDPLPGPELTLAPADNTAQTQAAQAWQTETAAMQTDGVFQLWDMMSYTVQSGDTLPALAARFRTTIENISADNPALSPAAGLTTLTPGQVLSIRLVVEPFWDERVLILPNSLFVNGPVEPALRTAEYIAMSNGWLKNYVDRSGEKSVTGTQIVESIANNYSLSPRLLLTLLEYNLHALSDPAIPVSFSLGNMDVNRRTLGRQLSWAANILNNGYYGWRRGNLSQFAGLNGYILNPNPWENAATVAIQYYFAQFLSQEDYIFTVSQNNFLLTYQSLFGQFDWNSDSEELLIPANLQQPDMRLPFQSGLRWALTAGPHSGWGIGAPWAAIDFAPPAEIAGCTPSEHWAVAMADGLVTRSEDGVVFQDLDGDGNSRTGWVIFYLHVFPDNAPSVGVWLKRGDLLGHPSCVGGQSTGRNLHVARLYNGEWIPAGGIIPLTMDGWEVAEGDLDYKGSLSRGSQTVYPSNIGIWSSQLTADP